MTIPHAVVGYMIIGGMTPVEAWRRHLGLSQSKVAVRIGISQPVYAQQEHATKPSKAIDEMIAAALGITPDLLEI